MKLNIDDTQEEQYINSMHRETDALLNCMHCSRLFYMNNKIARDRLDHNIPLLCARCRLEENLLSIKHHAIQVRNKYKECVDEQIEKTEELWSTCDNKIKESQTKIKSVEASFDGINKLINEMHSKLNGLPIYGLNEAMDTIERFNNMSQKDKDAMELLLGLTRK